MLEPRFIHSLSEVSAEQWNAVAGCDYPFTRYEFLWALEETGATTADSGWEPRHLLLSRGEDLVALLPLYLKHHSYGEYVFDWSWADAYRRYGLAYYPKLLAAIPFTPATGPRLCLHAGEDREAALDCVVTALRAQADRKGASSVHVLFPDAEESARWQRRGLATRVGPQYHWYNRNYTDFDAFLAGFASRKRKSLRRERRRVAEQGLSLRVVEGRDIDAELWRR
ncbi:MAG: peptidogalycan biosysnthesis protein, partial [Oceanisphaera sp.]|nr:peptidogalycan biosysnthesis protein [Oceanisphaera sp.]